MMLLHVLGGHSLKHSLSLEGIKHSSACRRGSQALLAVKSRQLVWKVWQLHPQLLQQGKQVRGHSVVS